MSPRDSQRSRCYAAERTLWTHTPSPRLGGDPYAAAGGRLETIPEIQAWVDTLTQRAWFRRRYGVRLITVTSGRGARGGHGAIHPAPWARCRLVILHEVAHAIVPIARKHDAVWARTFLTLVRYALGTDWYARLRTAFRAHGVRYRRRRHLRPETRAALRARMVALNAARRVRGPAEEGVGAA